MLGKKEKKLKEDKKEKKSKKGKDATAEEEDSGGDSPMMKENSGGKPASPQGPAAVVVPAPAARLVDDDLERKRAEAQKLADDRKKEEAKREAERKEAERKEAERKAEAERKEAESKKQQSQRELKKDDEAETNIEVESLEAAKFDMHDAPTVYKDQYAPLPKEIYESYGRLQAFGRDLNTPIPPPEFVFVGKKGQGKSSLIEAFFGEQLANAGTSTRRPVFLNVINNLQQETPRITIKRDAMLREFDHDLEVSAKELSTELSKRSQTNIDEPIVVHYESRTVTNLTLIDTPGLLDADEQGGVTRAHREALITGLARPSERFIVAVEGTREWAKMDVLNFVKKIDPELSRTAIAYTKFQSHLQSFTSTRDVNKFLSGTLPDLKSFFVSLPSAGVRARFSEPDKFQKKIYQAYRRDINGLELLRFDKKYDSFIGVHAFRRFLLSTAWRSYQESVPRVLKQLRFKRSQHETRVQELEEQLKGLDSSKLRSIASNYVVNFLQVVERLISGTSEGNPAVNGQSLDEEKNTTGSGGDWVDLYNRVIPVEPVAWKIPYWDNKLYGGQQFERLLAEFNAVSGHTEMPEVTMDDVATAAGVNKLNNIPNYAWAASDLAQQKSYDAFMPLIEQLTTRAVFIMKRLTDIAERVLDGRKKKWLESVTNSVEDTKSYPYFTYNVKDLYNKFVEQTAKACKDKCLDEFYSTRTIYWDYTESASNKALSLERTDQDDLKTAVVDLSTQLFLKQRERITKNVMLKFYNFFLVPIQSELWTEIQGKVNCYSDSTLETIFEVASTKDKLQRSIKDLQTELSKAGEQDKMFLEFANSFSRPIAFDGKRF
eukprot:TRINITY_DN2920_c0_g3_i1.p1 TRINITY_DN2920_c0_g3~~TRINITY_DN2920_c0_g3_i1.p1  ORF type:complete len:831 (+),score=329.51 TRINITY_DN2920_c0_g3_i1:129-2621(+)